MSRTFQLHTLWVIEDRVIQAKMNGQKRLSYSEFTRDRLDKDYNPMLHSQRFRHFVDVNRKRRFMAQVKDQLSASNRAISTIKGGKYLKIDLNTKSNFKTVNELRTQLQEDVDFDTDQYRVATLMLDADLQIIYSKKKVLFDKIKARKRHLSINMSVPLPKINKTGVGQVPAYKLRLLKKQKEIIKLYPLKHLKPQLLAKFKEIYSQII